MEKTKEKSVYVICPVRNAAEDEKVYLEKYVSELREQGFSVHFPPQDTNQNDSVGTNICNQNFDAIIRADEIHIFWNPKSTGSLFDFGGVYMAMRLGMEKKIVLVNPIEATSSKSFENVILALSKRTGRGVGFISVGTGGDEKAGQAPLPERRQN